jgi:hypothetical protein
MRLTHAATLGLDGRGVLIVGASGSGKSGTALAGLLNGLDSLGDDYVLVEQGQHVAAHAVFKIFKQDPEGLRRAGLDTARIDTSLNWHGKIEFEVARFSSKALAGQMEIFGLLLPKITRQRRTTIERATLRESALALAPSGVLQLPGDKVEGFGFLAGLVRRLPAFHARLSENPAEIADAIGSFLVRTGQNAG